MPPSVGHSVPHLESITFSPPKKRNSPRNSHSYPQQAPQLLPGIRKKTLLCPRRRVYTNFFCLPEVRQFLIRNPHFLFFETETLFDNKRFCSINRPTFLQVSATSVSPAPTYSSTSSESQTGFQSVSNTRSPPRGYGAIGACGCRLRSNQQQLLYGLLLRVARLCWLMYDQMLGGASTSNKDGSYDSEIRVTPQPKRQHVHLRAPSPPSSLKPPHLGFELMDRTREQMREWKMVYAQLLGVKKMQCTQVVDHSRAV